MPAKQYGSYSCTGIPASGAQTSLGTIINSAAMREEGSGELIVSHRTEEIGETRSWSRRPLQRSLLLLLEESETPNKVQVEASDIVIARREIARRRFETIDTSRGEKRCSASARRVTKCESLSEILR